MTPNLRSSPHLSPISCLFCNVGVVSTLLVPNQKSLSGSEEKLPCSKAGIQGRGHTPLPFSLQFISLAPTKPCLLFCPHTYSYIVLAKKEQDTTETQLQRLTPNTAKYPFHLRSSGFISSGPTTTGLHVNKSP